MNGVVGGREVTKAQMLDDIEDSLLRAEKAQKDRDLIVALRAVYMILRDEIKKEGQNGIHGNDGAAL